MGHVATVGWSVAGQPRAWVTQAETGLVVASIEAVFIVVIVIADAVDTIAHGFVDSACLARDAGGGGRLGAVYHIARLG